MKRVDLGEYDVSPPLDLTPDEIQALQRHRAIELVPVLDRVTRWRIRARQYVGIVQLDDLEIRIQPKVAVQRLYFMLTFGADPDGWSEAPTELGRVDDLIEAVAHALAYHSEQALLPGILQGYVTTEEALPALRGRLREGDQMRRRLGMPVPLEVTFDDFSADIPENQLLRSAAELLLRLPIDGATRRRIVRLRSSLSSVSVLNVGSALPALSFTRLNRRYRPATAIARLILQDRSIEFDEPDVPGTTFLFDMNQVFEDFVTAGLRRALQVRGGRVEGQRRAYLDEAERIVLRPDVSWWSTGGCRAVADAKYKAVSVAQIPNPDAYQVFAYCTALNLPVGHLVYPTGETDPTVYVIRNAGIEIQVHTLPLDEPPRRLLAAVEEIADRIANADSSRSAPAMTA